MALHLAQHRVYARARARRRMLLVRSGPISKGRKSSASVERCCHQVTSNAFFKTKAESRLIEPTLTGFLKCTKTEKSTPNSAVYRLNPVPRQHLFQRTVTPDPDSPGGRDIRTHRPGKDIRRLPMPSGENVQWLVSNLGTPD